MTELCEYFSHKELACPCCDEVKLYPGWADALTVFRLAYNKPIVPTSACRCWNHHEAIYKKRKEDPPEFSQHLMAGKDGKGGGSCAIDIACTDKMLRYELIDLATDLGFRVGIAGTYIHIDGGHLLKRMPLVAWVYK